MVRAVQSAKKRSLDLGLRVVTQLELLEMLVGKVHHYRDTTAQIVLFSLCNFGFAGLRPFDTSMLLRKFYTFLSRCFEDPREVCCKVAAARYGGRSVPRGADHANAQ